MFASGFIKHMVNLMKSKKRARRKMYGSYQTYDNSKDQERAERRIYKYAEASEKHLVRIRRRLQNEHWKFMQKKVAVLTACTIIGALAIYMMLY